MRVKLPASRIQAIDAFRGLTIFTMIFVNELAGVSGIPSWMKHAGADDDAMTFVDIVFPAFLFIVGMSLPFSLQRLREKDGSWLKVLPHVGMRALGLIVMGVFMVNAEGGFNESKMGMSIYLWSLLFYVCVFLVWFDYPTPGSVASRVTRFVGVAALFALAFVYKDEEGGHISPRWWGILGLIGWAYLAGSLLYMVSQGNRFVLLLFVFACLAYYTLGHFAFRQNVFYDHPFFSQGGHAIHTAIVISGTIVSLIFYKIDLLATQRQRQGRALWFVLVMIVIALTLRPMMGISKIYATPSWAAYSVVICTLLFSAVYFLIENLRFTKWATLVKPSAMQPLLVYIIPFIVYAAMQALGLSFPAAFYEGAAGILWALGYAAIVMLAGYALVRMNVRLRL